MVVLDLFVKIIWKAVNDSIITDIRVLLRAEPVPVVHTECIPRYRCSFTCGTKDCVVGVVGVVVGAGVVVISADVNHRYLVA